MATNFPTSLDSYATLVDNTDNIVAAHPNDRGDAIEAVEAKIGVDSSAVATSHTYLLTHLPGQAQNLDIGSYELRCQTLVVDKADGTMPMTITSTTKVSNLNVDQVDGAHASSTPTANYLVVADARGFLHTPSSAPDSDYEVANKKYVDDSLADISTGSLMMWAGAIASPPDGWLVCDGSAINRTIYATLYAVIGTTYGVGDGSTTFNLPNMTNRFPYGANEGSSAGNASVGSAKDRPMAGNDSSITLLSGSNEKEPGSGTCTAQNVNMMAPYLAVAFIIKT
jgi:hypothetical protein